VTTLPARAGDPDAAVARLLAVRAEFADVWTTLDRETASHFVALFREVDGPGKTILEIGSGYGLTCTLWALLGAAEVHGVELIPSAVAAAARIAGRVAPDLPVRFRQADVAAGLPYGDGLFDVVLMVEVLSHIVVADLAHLLHDVVRVLKPGGRVVISDGNNARSWKRRRENRRVWKRFDQGPPTGAHESVCGHEVRVPYAALRCDIARAAVPELSPDEAEAIAARTFGYRAAEVERAARRYRDSGAWPASPFRRGVCPVEPCHGTYIEQLVDPFTVCRHLRAAGCDDVACGPRRALPWPRLWRAFPWVVLLVSNGFKIVARRAPVRGSWRVDWRGGPEVPGPGPASMPNNGRSPL
jgi:SAM-dependent methyltransferase